ncbi:MAG TPA: hypothetical protein ENN06_12650 [Desulfobacteraceae bacterium]|nr:hypothetical protein [Desulfobacteraceae bacterium]
MVELFGGATLTTIVAVVNLLGLPGLVLIIWSADQRRFNSWQMRAQEERANEAKLRQEELAALKDQFVVAMDAAARQHSEVIRMYENNVILVKNYEKISNELVGLVHISTQTITKMTEHIENNMYCPIIRDGGARWGLTQRD